MKKKQSNKRDRIKGQTTKNISLIKGLLQIYSNRGSTTKNYSLEEWPEASIYS